MWYGPASPPSLPEEDRMRLHVTSLCAGFGIALALSFAPSSTPRQSSTLGQELSTEVTIVASVVRDSAKPGAVLKASSVPRIGMIPTLTENFSFNPEGDVYADGTIHTGEGIRFPDGSLQETAAPTFSATHYYEPDPTCVFDLASSVRDTLRNGSLPQQVNFGEGKITPECLHFGTAGQYSGGDVVGALNQKQTLEFWYYEDPFSNIATLVSSWSQTKVSRIQALDGTLILDGTTYDLGLPNTGENQWIYVVVVWDGQDVTLYVNGDELAPTVQATPAFTIGGGLFQLGDQLLGRIDGVRVLVRAMTATEVSARFNSFK